MKVCPKCGGTGTIQDDKILGAQLKKKREKAGLPLREVARQMGLSASYICDLEHGRRSWSADLKKRYHGAVDHG